MAGRQDWSMVAANAADAVIKGGAAITLLYFLDSKKGILESAELCRLLTKISASVLQETSDCSLLNCLKKCGWNESYSCYDRPVDVEILSASLRKIIEKREDKLSTFRSSQVGIRNTIKSFASDMLMTYTMEQSFHIDTVQLTPFSVFFDGVCLLADISGFTRLSGKFCKDGRDGIDQLQQATNGYLGNLVKIVYSYGGDVMKFAGDALVCVFRPNRYSVGGRESTVADICSRAVQCATELAQACTDELTVHVALSCGSICFAMIGGYNNIWECLVSGECFGHLSKCLEDAASKQTVVSPQFFEMLGVLYRGELSVEKLSSGNYLVISVVQMNSSVVSKMIKKRGEMLMQDCESRFSVYPHDDEFLTAILHFIPVPVSVGLMTGGFDYLAELREVTTMFMSWDSYDEVGHRNLLDLQKYLIAAQKTISLSGGFIRQFLVDDKGCVLIACWGVPTASHPDNSRRAICAAAMIGHELNKLGMKTSAGITTGNVFCGSVGSYVRREYAVIGDVVNLAARLMSKADGGLYTDKATYSRIPGFLQNHLTMLSPVAIKGKDILVTPYSLRRDMDLILYTDKGDFNHEIRSICKKPLLENLIAISTTKEKVPLKFVLIEGKMGTGTDDVGHWLKEVAPSRNIKIIFFTATCRDSTSDYSVAAQLFRLLVDEMEFDDLESQKVVVRRILKAVYKEDKETAEKVCTRFCFDNRFHKKPSFTRWA